MKKTNKKALRGGRNPSQRGGDFAAHEVEKARDEWESGDPEASIKRLMQTPLGFHRHEAFLHLMAQIFIDEHRFSQGKLI